jgi:cell division protein FtsB
MSTRAARAPIHSPGAAGLRLVRRSARRLLVRSSSRRVAPIVIVGAMFVIAVIFAVLLEQVVLAQSSFKVADVRARMLAAEERHEELLLEAARLASPDRIESYARDVLGMTDAIAVKYIVADIKTDPQMALRVLPRRARRVVQGTSAVGGNP